MPIRTELDAIPAMTALHQQGARIAVPVIAGRGLPLDFREWTPDCPLIEGPFGALIPEGGDWLTPDTLIVPLVGFDAACNRLGYGGGSTTRTLARLQARAPTRAPVRKIGFAFAAQQLPPPPAGRADRHPPRRHRDRKRASSVPDRFPPCRAALRDLSPHPCVSFSSRCDGPRGSRRHHDACRTSARTGASTSSW